MKKKMFILLIMSFLILTGFTVKPLNDTPTRVTITTQHIEKGLPTSFVVNQNLPTYTYDGREVLDFRHYFRITTVTGAERKTVLDMYSNPIVDEGGYRWRSTIDLSKAGTYKISISYPDSEGKNILSEIPVTVTETDITPPEITPAFAEVFELEAGDDLGLRLAFYKIKDNIDGITNLVTQHADGTYEINQQYFSGIPNISDTKLGERYPIKVRVADKAGNVFETSFDLIIKDTKQPVIYHINNIEANRNKPVDYKGKLQVTDNHAKYEDLTIEYHVVNKNGEVIGDEVDFSKFGEHSVRVSVTDLAGNTAQKVFRVIVKNPISIPEIILYINVLGIAVVGIFVGIHFIVKKGRKNANQE